MLDARIVEERLRRLDWRRLGVCHVLLIGSLARRGRGRDVDLLVIPCDGRRLDAEERLRIVLEASEALGIEPDLVDVVDAGEAPCPLLVDAARHHHLIYTVDRSALLDALLHRLSICEDEEISARRLGLIDAALKAAARRWGRWASSRGSTTQ